MIRAALCLAGGLATAWAMACAPVPPAGVRVDIEQEEAIILWDAATRTQHFIRRASFNTSAKDFGFLVPTPTQPELAEANDLAFDTLAAITAPRKVRRKSWWDHLLGDEKRGAPKPAAAPRAGEPVTVLERKVVGGLDAAVLEATEAAALDAWLKQNGYASSPELLEWYKPYIAAKWKISAFKIAGAARASAIETKAVRMSFRTEQPFFPYREPVSIGGDARTRLLRVYFIGDARFDGRVGEKGSWTGKTEWSKPLPVAGRDQIYSLVSLPAGAVNQAAWLTEFEDRASPRPANDEVYFRRAADQSGVERPDVVIGTPLWFDVVSFALVAGILYGAVRFLTRLLRR